MRLTTRCCFLLFFIFSGKALCAQLCNGSLGDPVVFIDFGRNGGNQLSSGTNTYNYQNNSCPNDGSYTVLPNSPNCFNASWHVLSEDHTPGDVNGNMMIVNASVSAGDFFVTEVSGLCVNTSYEFSAWIMNMMLPSACSGSGTQPNISFQIETLQGAVLGTYNTGNIPSSNSPSWKQYGLFFSLPAGLSSVRVRMTNNAPGGCGNDLALDDISFRPCGPRLDAEIQESETENISFCENDSRSVTFSVNGTGYADPAWQWQQSNDNGGTWEDMPGETSAALSVFPTEPGNYYYRVSAAERQNIGIASCRVASNALIINVYAQPEPEIKMNQPACIGQPVNFDVNTGATWNWSGPGGFSSSLQNPSFIATPGSSGNYRVEVISEEGCTATADREIQVFPTPEAFAGTDQTICAGNAAVLQATGMGDFQWWDQRNTLLGESNTITARPSDSAIYHVAVTNTFGCTDRDTVQVHVNQPPKADAGPDLQLLEGDSVRPRSMASGTAVTIAWSPGISISGSNEKSPLLFPVENTVYRMEVRSGTGCGTSSDEMNVRVFRTPQIPNVFSPNGDGINDTWDILFLNNYPNARLEVFNRNGQKLFSSKSYPAPWNGTANGQPLPAGTYYYVIQLLPELPLLKGWVAIVR